VTSRSKKRKPDLRLIRTSHTYTVPEIAKTLDRTVATVRGWIRDGLPILERGHPLLVLGSDLKTWLSDRWASRKRPCVRDEFYCFSCQEPRRAAVGSVEIVPRNEKTVTVMGMCAVCGTPVKRFGSRTGLAELEDTFRPFKRDMQHIAVCDDPCVKRTSAADSCAASETEPNLGDPDPIRVASCSADTDTA
jgi:hypothetical protein